MRVHTALENIGRETGGNMNRKETTKFLSDLLIHKRFGRSKYWAREVSIDYGTREVKRVDFMEFQPAGVVKVSGIEKGLFISYEVKSCKADYNSGFGKNFETEKNYLVMPMQLYKELRTEIPHNVGVICPVPVVREIMEEFEDPTQLDAEVSWDMKVVKPAITIERRRSMTELLFCMLRSGH